MARSWMCALVLTVPALAFADQRDETRSPISGGSAAAGGAHSVLSLPDGRVLAWGKGSQGQLGNGDRRSRSAPTPVAGLSDITMVAAGHAHTLARSSAGVLYAWGANGSGQLGDGSIATQRRPVPVLLLKNVVSIAAGRAHSLALTADGHVFSWGANDQGQLGLGSTLDVTIPTEITALSGIVAIAAGHSHSLAINRTGELFAWGGNAHGQLGDGSRTHRVAPIRINIDGVVAIAAGRSHTLVLLRTGDVYSWGRGTFGQLGTGSSRFELKPRVVAGVKAIAIETGANFSAAVRADGVLVTWGANRAGQLGDGTTINRSRPVEVRGLVGISTLALGDVHGIAVTSDGSVQTWGNKSTTPTTTIAGIEHWGPPFGTVETPHGELAAPVISPGGGTFTQAPLVTITSLPGARIRYTLDGTDPNDGSTLYTGPIQIPPTGAHLKARAWHVDWSPSAIVSESYVTDITPPTIVAHVSPPLADGWMMTAVTVTFTCEDDSGHVACSAPVVVDTDGRDQLIRGTATDGAGNQTSTSVVVSLDLRPPSIAMMDSPDGTSVAESAISLNAAITDAGSGVNEVLCNGASVVVSAGVAGCLVPLRPGVNSLTMSAKDVVGHVSSVGLTITRLGVASAIQLSPVERTLLVDELASFSLRDDFGALVTGADWSSSDEAVVRLSADDPPHVTAVAAGTAIISARKDGLSSEVVVNVRAGVELEPGTTRWSVAATPGYKMGFPLYTTRVDVTVPPIFIVETATHGEATLHAATPEGEILWRQHSPGVPLMGDAFGGVIAGVLYDEFQHSEYRTFMRLGNAGGVVPWRYNSPGSLLAPAQAADGTIYAIEYILGAKHDGSEIWDKYATVIDGRSGQLLNRTLLARETDTWITTSPSCPVRRREEAPEHAGPIVGPDGRGYLLVRRYERTKTVVCFDEYLAPRTIDLGLDLIVMSAQESPAVEPIHSAQCVAARNQLVVCDAGVEGMQVVPDGIGGILSTWRRATHMTDPNSVFMQTSIARRTGTGSYVDIRVPEHTLIYSVGQAGTALVTGIGNFSAIDVTSGMTRWTVDSSAGWPIGIDPDGGAALQHPSTGQLQRVTSTGQIDAAGAMTLPVIAPYHQFGSWIGVSQGGLRSVAGAFTDATRWQPATGNVQKNLRLSTPGVGIFAKSHMVQQPITFQHTSIRITPTFQDFWRKLKPNDFVNIDDFGNYFMTIGAGTADGDSSYTCTGALTKGINRERDAGTRPVNLEQLPVGPLEEIRLINDLYMFFGNYLNDLPYACVPEMFPGRYNSNSFTSGILKRAGAPLPLFPLRGSIPPGWATPVPPEKFNP